MQQQKKQKTSAYGNAQRSSRQSQPNRRTKVSKLAVWKAKYMAWFRRLPLIWRIVVGAVTVVVGLYVAYMAFMTILVCCLPILLLVFGLKALASGAKHGDKSDDDYGEENTTGRYHRHGVYF